MEPDNWSSAAGSTFDADPTWIRQVVAPLMRELADEVKTVGDEVGWITLSATEAGHPLAAAAVGQFTEAGARHAGAMAEAASDWAYRAEVAAATYAAADANGADAFAALLRRSTVAPIDQWPAPAVVPPVPAAPDVPAVPVTPDVPAPAAVSPDTGVPPDLWLPTDSGLWLPAGAVPPGLDLTGATPASVAVPEASAADATPGPTGGAPQVTTGAPSDTATTTIRTGLGIGFGMGTTYTLSLNPATGSTHVMVLVPFPFSLGPGLWQTFIDRLPAGVPAPAEGIGAGRLDVIAGIADGPLTLTRAAQLYPGHTGAVIGTFTPELGAPGTQLVIGRDQNGNASFLWGVNNVGLQNRSNIYGGLTYTVPITVTDRSIGQWLSAIEHRAAAVGHDVLESIGKAAPGILSSWP